ncbi:MAG: DEAD/DEAH box helicase [Clostridiales bacterium]|nr:DEAD/DEAH box helicase [Clostridiales bacterium]
MSRFEPHKYQRYCIDKIIDNLNIALWLDMGLGKTVITLTALYELKYYYCCIRKALVIAPKKVAESTWSAEQGKWVYLRHLRVSVVLGTEAQRKKALAQTADVYVINRENTQWIAQLYGHNWPFDVVVLDESSSFKSHTAKRFKALKAMRPKISRMIELTGTPSPHGLMDLWAQMYLLDGGVRLGRTISTYREMFFVPDKRNRTTIFSYAPKDGAADAIYRLISDICISMKSEDYLQLPDLVYDDIPVKLDDKAQKAYDRMERDMLLEVDDEMVTAMTAASLTGKLLQLCNGAVYAEDGEVVPVHDCKIDAFLETVEQLNGQHAIVYYYFKHDRERLLQALKKSSLRVRVYTGAQDEKDWNAGKIDLLLAQPASCGYGLNLQYGGHHAIWFGLTWSLEEYQQANKRLHRQGQPYPVIIHRLITQKGTDEDVVRSLECKDGAQESLLQALKARIDKAKGEA